VAGQMLTEGGSVMSHCRTPAAPALSRGTIEVPAEQAAPLVFNDPSVVALIAEVDAILCAAARKLLCRPPAPPAIGCALGGPRCAGWSWQVSVDGWRGPAHRVDAMQRGPPRARTTPKLSGHRSREGR
jgi:hypothetical protein